MRSRIRWALLVVGAALNVSGVMDFSLRRSRNRVLLKTRTATLAKHFVIRRASRKGIPPRPADIKASREVGGAHCGLDCGICHGVDGRAQTASGRWMSPRATDLTSSSVQNYSDQELNWIIENRIRFTGMPGFDKVETPEHIWAL
jgi:mono/diheme cytochrome c family protein